MERTEFKSGDIVHHRDDRDRWGVVTSMSDDGECTYYRAYFSGRGPGYGSSGGKIVGVRTELLERD